MEVYSLPNLKKTYTSIYIKNMCKLVLKKLFKIFILITNQEKLTII